jgi:antitoxin YefM
MITTGGAMKQLSDAEVLARYDEVLDVVAKGGEEVVITREGNAPVVMVALAEYEALKETLHLLRSPANANRVLDAVGRLEAANDDRQKSFLLALRESAAEVGGVDIVVAPRTDLTRSADLS